MHGLDSEPLGPLCLWWCWQKSLCPRSSNHLVPLAIFLTKTRNWLSQSDFFYNWKFSEDSKEWRGWGLRKDGNLAFWQGRTPSTMGKTHDPGSMGTAGAGHTVVCMAILSSNWLWPWFLRNSLSISGPPDQSVANYTPETSFTLQPSGFVLVVAF